LIKIKGFWSTFYSYELYTYAGFSMVVLQQTWFLEVFPNLEINELVRNNLLIFFNVAPDLVNFSPYNHASF
jgi:hypothetical protein